MHEVSLVHALFDQLDRAIAPHPASAVRLVTVRVGELAGVEPTLLRTAFEGCRGERGFAAAELALTEERAAWRCRACGAPVPRDDGALAPACPCGGRARLDAGDALVFDRVELEVVDV